MFGETVAETHAKQVKHGHQSRGLLQRRISVCHGVLKKAKFEVPRDSRSFHMEEPVLEESGEALAHQIYIKYLALHGIIRILHLRAHNIIDDKGNLIYFDLILFLYLKKSFALYPAEGGLRRDSPFAQRCLKYLRTNWYRDPRSKPRETPFEFLTNSKN